MPTNEVIMRNSILHVKLNTMATVKQIAIIFAHMCDDVMSLRHFRIIGWPFVGESLVDSHHKGPVTQSFNILFTVNLNKLLYKQPIYRSFRMPQHQYDVIIIPCPKINFCE